MNVPSEWTAPLSALAGVLLGAILALWRDQVAHANQGKVRTQGKYESMVSAYVESLPWLTGLTNASSQSEILGCALNVQANKAHMLCLLYFPEIRFHSGQYLDACTHLYQVVAMSYSPHRQGNVFAQVQGVQAYTTARATYDTERAEFLRAIQFHTGKYASI
jgi:hypothetical protein